MKGPHSNCHCLCECEIKELAPFVCYVSVMMLTACVSLSGRGESTADEGTCWLWTKEWWRNGCQNLRYCCVFKCMFWVMGGGGTMFKSTNPIPACSITSAEYFPHVNKCSLKCCIPGKNGALLLKHAQRYLTPTKAQAWRGVMKEQMRFSSVNIWWPICPALSAKMTAVCSHISGFFNLE